MPQGTRHEETGWLNARERGYVLRRDGGGEWRLDLGWRDAAVARRLAGSRVRVIGSRDGFDLLAVDRLEPLHGEHPFQRATGDGTAPDR